MQQQRTKIMTWWNKIVIKSDATTKRMIKQVDEKENDATTKTMVNKEKDAKAMKNESEI